MDDRQQDYEQFIAWLREMLTIEIDASTTTYDERTSEATVTVRLLLGGDEFSRSQVTF